MNEELKKERSSPIFKSKRRHALKVIDRKWSAATQALKNKQK
jgi:hypothetical protein